MQKIIRNIFCFWFVFMCFFSCTPVNKDDEKLTLFVAAGMAELMEKIAEGFSQKHDVEVEIHFSSSGTLVKQLDMGNNADIYVSASKKWMEYACQNRLVLSSDVFQLAETELVLTGQDGLPFESSAVSQLSDDFDGHLAIGDPKYVPAGRYAVEALKSLDVYEDFRDKILPCKDVRSVLSMVETGECRYGIVYKSMAMRSDRAKILTTFPSGTHEPVLFSGAIVKGTDRTGLSEKFLEYVTGNSRSLRMMEMYGYTRP